VRVDTGVAEGGEISLYYDPMIAKLVTHADTRARAIAAQAQALDAFVIEGIRHNVPFLARLMQHPRWRAGQLSTAFIAEEFPDGFHALAPQGEDARILAAIAAALDHIGNARKRRISGQLAGPRVRFERVRIVRLGEAEHDCTVEERDGAIAVRFASDGRELVLRSSWKIGELLWSGSVDGAATAARVRPVRNGFALARRGIETIAFVFTPAEAAAARLMPAKTAADTGKAVRCPMPGLVMSIAVVPGQEVKTGETLAVVEAMKMENVLRAERDGVIKAVHAKPGESLAVDAVILEFASRRRRSAADYSARAAAART
jgi:propionyl-CoA carboxylase alpha chain